MELERNLISSLVLSTYEHTSVASDRSKPFDSLNIHDRDWAWKQMCSWASSRVLNSSKSLISDMPSRWKLLSKFRQGTCCGFQLRPPERSANIRLVSIRSLLSQLLHLRAIKSNQIKSKLSHALKLLPVAVQWSLVTCNLRLLSFFSSFNW